MLSQANIGTFNERNLWQIPKILKQAVPEIWHLNTGQISKGTIVAENLFPGYQNFNKVKADILISNHESKDL